MKKIFLAGYPDTAHNYKNAFAALGIPADTLLQEKEPVFESRLSALSDLSGYDGLVLPGGGDIVPALFGAENQGSRNMDESLDRIQLYLLESFVRAGKPVLGICKGLQILNVYFGGTLIQDLPPHSLSIHAYQNGDRIHTTKAARGTFPEKLYGSTPITNSAHHQGIHTPAMGCWLRSTARISSWRPCITKASPAGCPVAPGTHVFRSCQSPHRGRFPAAALFSVPSQKHIAYLRTLRKYRRKLPPIRPVRTSSAIPLSRRAALKESISPWWARISSSSASK